MPDIHNIRAIGPVVLDSEPTLPSHAVRLEDLEKVDLKIQLADGESAVDKTNTTSLMTPSSTYAAIQSHKITESVVFSVGPSHELKSISDAFSVCSELTQTYKKTSPHIVLELENNFILNEQVILDHGVNLSNVSIRCNTTVVINRSALTTEVEGYYPAFTSIHFAKFPRIDAVFVMNTTGTSENRVGFLVSDGACGWINVEKGFVGAPYGAVVRESSSLVCDNAKLANSTRTGLFVSSASTVSADGVNVSHAGQYGIHIRGASAVSYEGAITTNAGVEGVFVEFDVEDYGEY